MTSTRTTKTPVDLKTITDVRDLPELVVTETAIKEAAELENQTAISESTFEKKPRRVKHYLNNKDMLAEVLKSKAQGRMTENLGKMLIMLCRRYATRPNLIGYSYNEDMQGFALVNLCRTWASFNEEKTNNPFAYYTQCVKNSFNYFLNIEKNERVGRDKLRIEQGLDPSWNYQQEHASQAYDAAMDASFSDDSDAHINVMAEVAHTASPKYYADGEGESETTDEGGSEGETSEEGNKEE